MAAPSTFWLSALSPPQAYCVCPETVHHTRHKRHVLREPRIHQEHPAMVSSEWAKWMKRDSDYWSCAPFMTCALQTPSSAPSLNTRFPGDTRAQSTGNNYNLIWFWSGVLLLRTFSIHALTTVRTAIQTTPWCAVRSGCNRSNSIAQRQRGTFVWMSARCLNQTSGSSSLKPYRRNLAPCNSVTALATFGKRSLKSHDWFEAKSAMMNPVIDVQTDTLERKLQILRIARSKAQ